MIVADLSGLTLPNRIPAIPFHFQSNEHWSAQQKISPWALRMASYRVTLHRHAHHPSIDFYESCLFHILIFKGFP